MEMYYTDILTEFHSKFLRNISNRGIVSTNLDFSRGKIIPNILVSIITDNDELKEKTARHFEEYLPTEFLGLSIEVVQKNADVLF